MVHLTLASSVYSEFDWHDFLELLQKGQIPDAGPFINVRPPCQDARRAVIHLSWLSLEPNHGFLPYT